MYFEPFAKRLAVSITSYVLLSMQLGNREAQWLVLKRRQTKCDPRRRDPPICGGRSYRCSNVRDIKTSWRRRGNSGLRNFKTKEDLIMPFTGRSSWNSQTP